MTSDDSMDMFRDAVKRNPHLVPETPVRSADEPLSVGPSDTSPASASCDKRSTAGHPDFGEDYEIIELLSNTQLSRTWKARDKQAKTLIVIKEPLARITIEPDALQRFRQEVHIVASLVHGNIAPINGRHLNEPPYFFTMPFIEGMHLDEYCIENRLDLRQQLQLFVRVCEPVRYAHDHGFIHRDLKPANILVDEEGTPHLLDFGLGRLREQAGVAASAESCDVVGTPPYMAPEQADGRASSIQTDVYALAAVLYELLTGTVPIAPEPTEQWSEYRDRILAQPPIPPRNLNDEIGFELNAVILKALSKDWRQRHGSVAELARDLQATLEDRPVSAVADSPAYRCRKWLRRNRHRVLGATAIVATVALITGTLTIRHWKQAARLELERNIAAARGLALMDDPLAAERLLWQEHKRWDSQRTRFALWEFYRQYPCLYHISDLGPQRDVAFSPDANWIATVTADQRVVIYEAAGGAIRQIVSAERVRACSIAWSPATDSLFVGGTDGGVRNFVFESGQLRPDPASTVIVDDSPITALTVEKSSLAAGSASGIVEVWRLEGSQLAERLRNLDGPGRVMDVVFDRERKRLAAAAETADGRLGGVNVWDLEASTSHHLEVPSARGVLFEADSNRVLLATGQWLRRWAYETDAPRDWKDLAHLETESHWGVRSIEYVGPSAAWIALASGDNLIRFMRRDDSSLLGIQGFHDAEVSDRIRIAASPDGRFLASVAKDGLRLWLCSPFEVLWGDTGRPDEIRDISYFYGDSEILTVSVPDSVLLFARSQGEGWRLLSELKTEAAIGPVALDPTGSRVAVVTSSSRVDGSKTSEIRVVGTLDRPGQNQSSCSIEASPSSLYWLDDQSLLIGCADGTLRYWRVDQPVAEILVDHLPDTCSGIAATKDREWISACAEAGRVIVWRRKARNALATRFRDSYDTVSSFPTHAYNWNVALFEMSDGKIRLATSGSPADRDIHVWDPETGRRIRRLDGHRTAIFSMQALDQELIVSASDDKTVRIWNVSTGQEVCTLYRSKHQRPILSVSGGRIAIVDGDQIMIADTAQIEQFLSASRAVSNRPAALPAD